MPPLALFVRDRPADLGLAAYGNESRLRPAAAPEDNPVEVAFRALGTGIRLRDFWLIAGGYFVCDATTNGLIVTHLIPACVDHGLSEVAGAGVLAATGVFALVGGAGSRVSSAVRGRPAPRVPPAAKFWRGPQGRLRPGS